jgi:hypothetical protein
MIPLDYLPYDVECARCGITLSCADAFIEEGDEWECPDCFDRCEATEYCELSGVDFCFCDGCLSWWGGDL